MSTQKSLGISDTMLFLILVFYVFNGFITFSHLDFVTAWMLRLLLFAVLFFGLLGLVELEDQDDYKKKVKMGGR